MRQKTHNEKVWEETFLHSKYVWKPMLKCKNPNHHWTIKDGICGEEHFLDSIFPRRKKPEAKE